VEIDGMTVCKKVWDGKAEIEEFSVDSAETNKHILGLALRLYNPASHQWSIYWPMRPEMNWITEQTKVKL
jgi:hypothetical protein